MKPTHYVLIARYSGYAFVLMTLIGLCLAVSKPDDNTLTDALLLFTGVAITPVWWQILVQLFCGAALLLGSHLAEPKAKERERELERSRALSDKTITKYEVV